MNDEQLAEFICTNPLANRIYLMGYEAGHLTGQASMRLSQEQQAELAARRFYALEAYEIDHRRFAKEAIAAVDLVAARNAPGSSYVPRKAA